MSKTDVVLKISEADLALGIIMVIIAMWAPVYIVATSKTKTESLAKCFVLLATMIIAFKLFGWW